MVKYIQDHLLQHCITYGLHTHPPVFTCEEADKHCRNIPGLACKTLFLKSKKGEGYYLVLMPGAKRLQMKLLSPILGAKELTFAKPEELQSILGLTPGAVSPLGLLNDHKQSVGKVLVEQGVWDAAIVSFHPNINTETLGFAQADFHKLMASFLHGYVVQAL